MPFTSTPDQPLAVLTDLGRTNFARATLGEVSFIVSDFAVGRGGYDMVDPVKISIINPSLTDLEDQFYPVYPAVQPIEKLEYPTLTTVVVYCRLAQNDAIAGLGEIGIYGEIVYSTSPAEIGTKFLMAVAHMPLVTKTLKQVILYRVIIQF
jgi:hypothetical protein